MKYPPHILDEIRARLPVSEVVGRRVRLKRQGREFAGLSPFNPEKTPSFFVNDQKGFYHCFSSGKHGDVFRFLMETEGLSFPEAVERLAAETGVDLPKPDAREERREHHRASLADVCEMAARFFEESLKLTNGAAARAYVEKRRLEARTVREFRIGWAPGEREALKRHLLGKGVDEQAMIDAGLIIKPDDGRASYDRFRNRLMIPIQDEKGRVVAFGGRALSSEDNPKYLNSPETELFHKGFMLFNGHRARAAAYDQGSVIVVEGYLDAIAVWQAGIAGVVATLGTAFTEEQIQRMWRFAAEPLVCFDGDRAGIKAAHRAVDRILPHLKSGFSFNFVFLPDGKDPDELIQLGGAEAFRAEVERAVPLADVLWERETQGAAIDTPERKAALEKRLEDLVREIKDARVQRAYQLRFRLKLSNLFWTSERGERKAFRTAEHPSTAPLTSKPREVSERILLGLSVDRPDQFERLYDGILDHVRFNNDLHRLFWDELYRVVVSLDASSSLDIYRKLDYRFYMVYNAVYGIERADSNIRRAWGYNLRASVPILNFHPTESFVEDLLVHQADWLLLMQAEDDLKEEFLTAEDDLSEDEYDRLIAMRMDLVRRREEFSRRDVDIAEMARHIRKAFGEGGQGAFWKNVIAEMLGREV